MGFDGPLGVVDIRQKVDILANGALFSIEQLLAAKIMTDVGRRHWTRPFP